MDNVKLINCKLINTNLAFEYSTVEASINSHIDSIKNPIEGTIQANSIGKVILEKEIINPDNTMIETKLMVYPITDNQEKCVV